jgi:hypothetical protein
MASITIDQIINTSRNREEAIANFNSAYPSATTSEGSDFLNKLNRKFPVQSSSTTNTGSGLTGAPSAATQGFITSALSSQNISQSGKMYDFSTLEKTEDTIFQISDVAAGMFTAINDAKGNLGKVVTNLLGNSLVKIGEGVNQILAQEVNLRNEVNAKLGLTGDLSRGLRDNILDTLPAATSMAFGFESVRDYAVEMVENTGKMTTFGKDVLIESQKTARAFYGDLSKLSQAIDAFDKVGIGAKDAIKEIDRAGKSSLTLGLNARKVVAEVSSNMDKLNTIGFKNGVEGLTRMVQKSIEFNLNIEKVKGLAESLFDPDKAIALSAELQAIGGAIGDFNDPLKLMYMATNDAGGLQDAMIGVAGSLATYNTELGRFEITGANLRKAKALGGELNMTMEEMSKTAIKAAERSSAATALLSSGLQIDEKEKEFLTNISKMEGGRMVIDVPESIAKKMGLEDTKVALDELSPTIAKGLLENQKAFEDMSVEDIARDQYTVTQNIEKDVSSLLTLAKVEAAKGFRGGLQDVDNFLKEKLGEPLKKMTQTGTAENKDLEGFWKEVNKNTNETVKSTFEELKSKGVNISDENLAATKNIGKQEQVTTKNINLSIKSNDAVVDATTRAIINSPSIAQDIKDQVIPSELEYTSTTLPSKYQ